MKPAIRIALLLTSTLLVTSCFESDAPLYSQSESDCGFLTGRRYDVMTANSDQTGMAKYATWTFSKRTGVCRIFETNRTGLKLDSSIDGADIGSSVVFVPLSAELVLAQLKVKISDETAYVYLLVTDMTAAGSGYTFVFKPVCKNPNLPRGREPTEEDLANRLECSATSKATLVADIKTVLTRFGTDSSLLQPRTILVPNQQARE